MALADDIDRLSRTRPFSLLPREAVQLIAFAAEKRMLAPNELLFQQGELGDCGYFVLAGSIVLTAQGHAGERTRLAMEGALIGENAMVAEVQRPASAHAKNLRTARGIAGARHRPCALSAERPPERLQPLVNAC